MSKSNLKISDTTKRVALLLKELIKRPLSYDDMLKLFSENGEKPVYTTEVLNKYINTLRTLGLQIKRIDGKYTLLTFLYQLVLSKQETEVFNNIETSILKYGTDKNIKCFLGLKKKILKFFDANSQREINNYVEQVLTTPLGLKIKMFEKICDDELTVKIKYNGEIITAEPRQILFSDNKIYFECLDTKKIEIRKLPIQKVSLILQQPAKNKNIMMASSVVYEIMGRLAQNYILKEGESIIFQNDEKKVIKAENEDYELLIKRLIRYKNNCKIIKPVKFRDYFEKYTDRILSLYEGEAC